MLQWSPVQHIWQYKTITKNKSTRLLLTPESCRSLWSNIWTNTLTFTRVKKKYFQELWGNYTWYISFGKKPVSVTLSPGSTSRAGTLWIFPLVSLWTFLSVADHLDVFSCRFELWQCVFQHWCKLPSSLFLKNKMAFLSNLLRPTVTNGSRTGFGDWPVTTDYKLVFY